MWFIYRGGFSLWEIPCVYLTQSHLLVFYESQCFFENMIGLSKELKFSTLLCMEYTTNNCQANLFLFICSYMNESSCQLTCVCGLKQSWRGRILTVCSGSWLTVDLLWILFYYFFFFVKSIVYREEHGIGFGFSSFTDFAQRTSASHLTIKEGTSSYMCFIHLEGVLLQIDIRQLLFFREQQPQRPSIRAVLNRCCSCSFCFFVVFMMPLVTVRWGCQGFRVVQGCDCLHQSVKEAFMWASPADEPPCRPTCCSVTLGDPEQV